MPTREWKKISSSTAYEDHYMRIRKDEVFNPGGKRQHYAVVEIGDAVGIIAQDADGGIYLLREYRYPVQETLWQLPAGRLEKEMGILENAQKELKEETNITAKKWKSVGKFFLHASVETTQGFIFHATELETSKMDFGHQDDNELILGVEKIPLEKVKQMIADNEIKCGWTLAALNLFFAQQK